MQKITTVDSNLHLTKIQVLGSLAHMGLSTIFVYIVWWTVQSPGNACVSGQWAPARPGDRK